MPPPKGLTPEQLDRFAVALDELAPCGPTGLAVSGGPDSLALLLLAHAARPNGVLAATVDHGLRREAAREAAMVAEVCRSLGIPHATLTVAVSRDSTGIQAAARRARYSALGQWAREMGTCFLATAHHADDQAETLLMRLARGAGLTGLAGVRRSRPLGDGSDIRIIRPLLGWTKAELEEIARGAGLTPVRDPSNSDGRYDRTHARAMLTGGWPPARRVAAAADHLADAEEALDWAADHFAAERITQTEDDATLDYRDLPRELRRRLLLNIVRRLAPGVPVRGEVLDRVLQGLEQGRVSTLAGLRCDPGPPWRVKRAPPRYSGGSRKR